MHIEVAFRKDVFRFDISFQDYLCVAGRAILSGTIACKCNAKRTVLKSYMPRKFVKWNDGKGLTT